MELRVLRYFLSIARAGSLSQASAQLHITQPTISRQIKELEEELGQKLFSRGSKTLSLTPQGVLFSKRASEILQLEAQTKAEFAAMKEVLAGDVYLGCAETAAFYDLSLIFADIRKKYPDVHFHIYSGNDEDVLYRLDNGLLDFGVLMEPFSISRYSSLRLPMRERWGLIVPQTHPLTEKKSVCKEDLYDLPLIFSRQAQNVSPDSNAVINWFGEDFAKLRIVATFNLLFNALMMVKAGVGCIVSINKIITSANAHDVRFIPLRPRLESHLSVIWKKQKNFSRPASYLLQCMQETFVQGAKKPT